MKEDRHGSDPHENFENTFVITEKRALRSMTKASNQVSFLKGDKQTLNSLFLAHGYQGLPYYFIDQMVPLPATKFQKIIKNALLALFLGWS